MPWEPLVKSVVAGLIASAACGLGALPLWLGAFDVKRHAGLGYGLAGGLMMSASMYNLILPALQGAGQAGGVGWMEVMPVIGGLLVGAGFLYLSNRYLTEQRIQRIGFRRLGGRTELLVFVAMMVHSIPEGVAVGVGYEAEAAGVANQSLGSFLALAIALHNIPEGLAVALPMRARGASMGRCYAAAFLTSLPQPLAAIPAVLLASAFQLMMPVLMGFAAGAMIYLIVLELIPDALETDTPTHIAISFVLGFCLMILVQVAL